MNDSCAVPVIRDVDKVLSGDCKTEKGGDMTVKPPQYVLIVTNPDPPVTTN
jgi:hypothetical protein